MSKPKSAPLKPGPRTCRVRPVRDHRATRWQNGCRTYSSQERTAAADAKARSDLTSSWIGQRRKASSWAVL